MPKLVYMFLKSSAPAWFRPVFGADLDIAYYEPDCVYSSNTVFYYDMYGPYQELIPAQLAAGHKVIYDAKNEHYLNPDKAWIITAFKQAPGQGMFIISGHTPSTIPGVTIAATPYWYWKLDYDHYEQFNYRDRPVAPTHEHLFFMQLNLERTDRTWLFDTLAPVLDRALYSYKSRGTTLPNDVDPGTVPNWQRYINWDWVNSCDITLVVESNLDDSDFTGLSITQNNNRFICEKTYKPIAYGHAFLLASTQYNLEHVREQGFETWPELWDESYDQLPNYQQRGLAIKRILETFDPQALQQPSVVEKIAHNQNRYFDRTLVDSLVKNTVIDPVLAFVNS